MAQTTVGTARYQENMKRELTEGKKVGKKKIQNRLRMMEIFIQGTKRDNSRHRNHCKKHKTKSEENSTWQLGKGRPLQIKDL